MSLSTDSDPAAAREPATRLRFDGVERALHWANAALFLVLIATAALLYIGPLSAVVGRRILVKDIHVWSGLLLPAPLLIALAVSRRGGLFREDLRHLNRWTADDRRWLRSLGRDGLVRFGKFHPGQKLNAAFVAGSIPVMLATGAVMRWFTPFPDTWRTGATFVHDWIAVAVFFVVAGHIVKALSDGDSLRGMWSGRVRTAWAARHHPRW